MRVYTYSEAPQNLADLLNRAGDEGEVRIRRRDGSKYVIQPRRRGGSPLDVSSVNAEGSSDESDPPDRSAA